MKNEIRRFWNWEQPQEGSEERVLTIEGTIAEDSWWGDEYTPAMFRKELNASSGPIIVWINSYGGDVYAAAQIYNMIRDYPGKVTVKIDGIAASAASVIAMAGDEVLMSPVSTMMIHNPWTIAMGDENDFKKVQEELKVCKKTIVNAYVLKTGKTEDEISRLMDKETFFEVYWAIENHFADGIIERRPITQDGTQNKIGRKFSSRDAAQSFVAKLRTAPGNTPSPKEPKEVETYRVDDLMKDLKSKKSF